MVSKISKIISVLYLLSLSFQSVYGFEFTINQMIEQSIQLDQSYLTFKAEVIGERLERGDMAWLNVSDNTNAIGVFLPLALTHEINYYGNYMTSGDLIQISGTLNRSCLEHNGELDFHADHIIILEHGSDIDHEISAWKFMLAFILLSTAWILFYLNRPQFLKRSRKNIKHLNEE